MAPRGKELIREEDTSEEEESEDDTSLSDFESTLKSTMDRNMGWEGRSVSNQEDAEEPVPVETRFDSWQTVGGIFETLSFNLDSGVMWKCLYFCYLFPKTYEFYKDDIIHIWLAQGFFPDGEMGEKFCHLYFRTFENVQIFLSSSLDSSTQRLRYKLNDSIVDLLLHRHNDDYCRVDDVESHVSENTLHYSCRDSNIDPVLYRAEKLRTLLILHQYGSSLDKIPRELFLNLPLLRVLDLSYTNILALPSSIAKLKDLRYLNLSGTPLTLLPNSLCNLYQLQILKLRGCLQLVGLPKDIRKLKCLRHLDLDLSCLLVSMPPGFGDLIELQSLPAFIVGKHDGCHINELRYMNNLGGTLRMLRLENVTNLEEAKEAALDQKVNVHKLEFHWTELRDGNELLQNLQPHRSIKELQITGYGSVRFPRWIGHPYFSQILTITIHDCKNCELLPCLGMLPLLSYLYISDMHEVKVIDHQFCRGDITAGLDWMDKTVGAFQSLVTFTLSGMPKLEEWSGIRLGDFPRLQKLTVSGCCLLTALPELSQFLSLRHLEISLCPLLNNFQFGGSLLGSLREIVIINCPLLSEWCHKEEEKAYGRLDRIPIIWIDHHQIPRAAHPGGSSSEPIEEYLSSWTNASVTSMSQLHGSLQPHQPPPEEPRRVRRSQQFLTLPGGSASEPIEEYLSFQTNAPDTSMSLLRGTLQSHQLPPEQLRRVRRSQQFLAQPGGSSSEPIEEYLSSRTNASVTSMSQLHGSPEEPRRVRRSQQFLAQLGTGIGKG